MSEFYGVLPALREAMLARDYSDLTPVQKAVLAPEAGTGDALVSAQTGSGKTVAFGLSIAHTLLAGEDKFGKPGAPLALIVAPTRELALQIKREFHWLYAGTNAVIGSCVGGMDIRTERRQLDQGTHIVIGTPGRLRDHLQRNSLTPDDIRAVVLDEADEMLDLGFKEDLEFILAATPETRRTLLFSATVPRGIANLAKNYQRDAVRISTTEEKKQHSDIEYRALTVVPDDRENAIVNVLRYYEAQNALIFCATRATVNHITARFKNRGFSVVALSGELAQKDRTLALQAMRDGRARVCVATDVAARGIDLPNLELVIHADLPTNAETLLHRSGRTGRAGRKGVSTLIVPLNKRRSAQRLLSAAKIDATWDRPPSAEEVTARDDARLLKHAALASPPDDEQAHLVAQLLEQYSAEQVAQAFIRAVRQEQSAPEDLQVVAPLDAQRRDPGKRERRERFNTSVWFQLSVGRKHNADPAWLLPLLCNGGQIKKADIGAIRIQPGQTFVEIDAYSVESFLGGIGPNKMLENSISVKQLDAPPTLEKSDFKKNTGFRNKPRPNHRGSKPNSTDETRSAKQTKRKKPKPGGAYDPQPSNHKSSTPQSSTPQSSPPKSGPHTAGEASKPKKPKKHKAKAGRLNALVPGSTNR
ncbi:MAG: DEAD/DEAH box helicase [Pseudomonadota bacterium]